jgi:hypothetical protein
VWITSDDFQQSELLMERFDRIGAVHSEYARKQPQSGRVCPECAERSYLRSLVSELLYKNQVLRFDLQSATEQLQRDHLVSSRQKGSDCSREET